MRYIEQGTGRIYADEQALITHTASRNYEYCWDVVGEAVAEAWECGFSTRVRGPGDLILAISSGASLEDALESGLRETQDWEQSLVGFSSDRIESPDPLVTPVTAWPVAFEAQQRVFEGEVLICHVINLEEFCGLVDGDARIVSASPSGLKVEAADHKIELPQHWLLEALYDFASVESVGLLGLELANRVIHSDVPDEFPRPTQQRPPLRSATSLEDYIDGSESPGDGAVLLRGDVFAQVAAAAEAAGRDVSRIPLVGFHFEEDGGAGS